MHLYLASATAHVNKVNNNRLTFAGVHAIKPAVLYIFVASTSTVLVPSTTRSATTDSSGFLEHATL